MNLQRYTSVLLLLDLVAIAYQPVSAGYSASGSMQSNLRNYNSGGSSSSSGSRRFSSSSGSRRFSSSSSSSSSSGTVGAGSMVVRYTGTATQDYRDDDDNERCGLRDCMPYIKMEETIQLSLEQRFQVRRKKKFIRRWRNPDRLRDAPSRIRHTPIVTLNWVQKEQILSRYGNYFSAQEELPPVVPAGAREKRGSVNICPGEEQWDALVLGMTNDNELVQVVQFPETGDKQWILDERCTQIECSFVSNCGCTSHTRLVRAAVISFDQSVVAEKYIKVYCCIARLLG